jgi:hypothetical protein
MLRKEIARLRALASGAAYDLKRAGEEGKANRLLRALEGRWFSEAAAKSVADAYSGGSPWRSRQTCA